MSNPKLPQRPGRPLPAYAFDPDVPASPGTGIEDDDSLDIPDRAPPELELLRWQQRNALEDLMNNKSYSEAARGAGVNRRTLYRWMKDDPAFKAALEGWRRRAVRSADDQLTQGARDAANTLSVAARSNYRAAALLLKSRGLLASKPAAATPVIEQILALPPDKRRLVELRLREMILSFREDPADAPAPAADAAPASPALLESKESAPASPAPAVAVQARIEPFLTALGSPLPVRASAQVTLPPTKSDIYSDCDPPLTRYVFEESLLPKGFRFPEAYLRLMQSPVLPNLGPWWFIGEQYDSAMFWHNAVRANDPSKSLIPFAKRDAGVHTLVLFDGTNTTGNPKVYHVCAYSDPGPTEPSSWNSFEEWLAYARKEGGE